MVLLSYLSEITKRKKYITVPNIVTKKSHWASLQNMLMKTVLRMLRDVSKMIHVWSFLSNKYMSKIHPGGLTKGLNCPF